MHPKSYLFFLCCYFVCLCSAVREDLQMWVLRKIMGPEEMQAGEHDRAGQ